jgi:hypothetical protein
MHKFCVCFVRGVKLQADILNNCGAECWLARHLYVSLRTVYFLRVFRCGLTGP